MSPPDPLTRALLPVLLHKLGNATQLLTGLNAMLSLEGGEELFARRSPDLSRCALNLNELGWALAVVGSGAGGDLLLERREPRGLSILLGLVGEACRRGGGVRIQPPADVPALAPGTLSGWELPWAAASLLLAAGEECDAERLEWSLEPCDSGGWRMTLPGGQGLAACAGRVLPLLPGAEWSIDGGLGVLRLPATWLRSTGE